MVLSASARSMKCQLKKKGYSETQIADYLLTNGYLGKIDNTEKTLPQKLTNVNNVNTDPKIPEPKLTDITEDTYKEYLLRVINNCDVDIRICTEIRNYLDKKNILKPQSSDLVQEVDPDQLQSQYDSYKKKGDTIAA